MSNIPSVIRNASLDELRRIARRYPRDLATYQANEWYWFTRLGHPLVHTVTTGNFFAQTSNHPKALTEEELKRLTSADLAVLALSASKTARIAAAEHADTPPATLSELAEDPEREVRRATGWNNATPPETIVRMEHLGRTDEISDWRLRLLWTELESAPLDEDVALDVARGNYYDAHRLGLARRKYVPSKLLTTLANYYKLDSETADVLAECRIRDVRRALAANDLGQFGTAVLARLAGDDDSEVRIAAGSNRHLPSEALAKLLDDPNASVRHEVTIAGSIEDDVLKEMDQNSARRPSLQARIIAGRGSEQLLRDLSVSPHPGTRAAVAQNTSTPMDVLEVLAEDDEQVVTQAVAHGLGFEVANRLFRDAYNLTEIWWYRRQLNKEDFQALMTSSSPRLRALGAQRHTGWFELGDLTRLAGDPDPQVRIAAATNP